MKCPYQVKTIHKREYPNNDEDITEFCECIKTECPFYFVIRKEHCRRAEKEKKI